MVKLWSELVILFVVLPIAVLYWLNHVADWLMPILAVVCLFCLCVLLADKQFQRIRLWHWEDYGRHLKSTLKLFLREFHLEQFLDSQIHHSLNQE